MAQLRVVDTALRQFEALKPVVVKLRQANAELRLSNVALRVGLTHADSSRAFTQRALDQQERLTANAEGQWQRYQGQSRRRGWTIAALALVSLLFGAAAVR